MNIQRKNSAHHFRMQSEREQTLVGYSAAIICPINIWLHTEVMGGVFSLNIHRHSS